VRSPDYFVLRTCERLGLQEPEFQALSYPEQLRLLAYEMLREQEESGSVN
jgi:hypothetical protein